MYRYFDTLWPLPLQPSVEVGIEQVAEEAQVEGDKTQATDEAQIEEGPKRSRRMPIKFKDYIV